MPPVAPPPPVAALRPVAPRWIAGGAARASAGGVRRVAVAQALGPPGRGVRIGGRLGRRIEAHHHRHDELIVLADVFIGELAIHEGAGGGGVGVDAPRRRRRGRRRRTRRERRTVTAVHPFHLGRRRAAELPYPPYPPVGGGELPGLLGADRGCRNPAWIFCMRSDHR